MILSIFCFSSCYEDLGSYDYDETVNDLTIKLESVYGVRKMDTTFVIHPVITQTHRADNSNLRYVWTVNTESDQKRGDTLSREETLSMVVNTKVTDFKYIYYIRLYVTDTITGGQQMIPTIFEITKPYEAAWMVLHRQDGITKLGSIEYIGNKMVSESDAYFKERGEHLKGQPGSLGVKVSAPMASYWGYGAASVLYCFTSDPEESGILRQDNGFELYGSIQKCIFPDHYAEFNTANAKVSGCDGGALAISNGRVFQGSGYGPRMYGMFPAGEVTGTYQITHSASGPHTHMAFDAAGHRFLHCYTSANYYFESRWEFNPENEIQAKMELITKDPQNATGVDLDNIGEDKEMVYMGGGYQYGQAMIASWQRQAIYAFAKSKSTNKSYIFEFRCYPLTSRSDPDDSAPFSGFFTINTPAGVTTETPMASSSAFNRLLFYAVDNRIYRLDFGSINGSSTLIYQHPNAAKTVRMIMAREGDQTTVKMVNGYPANRTLGVVFEMSDGSNNEVVILNLNNAGTLDSDGIRIQGDGVFGKIKDINFI